MSKTAEDYEDQYTKPELREKLKEAMKALPSEAPEIATQLATGNAQEWMDVEASAYADVRNALKHEQRPE